MRSASREIEVRRSIGVSVFIYDWQPFAAKSLPRHRVCDRNRRSSHMKNCDPLVSFPRFAIDRRNSASCFSMKFSSAIDTRTPFTERQRNVDTIRRSENRRRTRNRMADILNVRNIKATSSEQKSAFGAARADTRASCAVNARRGRHCAPPVSRRHRLFDSLRIEYRSYHRRLK